MREAHSDGQMTLDGFPAPTSTLPTGDERAAQAAAEQLSAALHAEHVAAHPDPWAGSAYAWLRQLPPAGRGRAAGNLLGRWLAANGLDLTPRVNTDHDRIVEGAKLEVKLSTAWTGAGDYTFQQLRPGDYDLVALVGVSPDTLHLWVAPQQVVLAHLDGGDRADGRWLTVDPHAAPAWLAPYGGTLTGALAALRAHLDARPTVADGADTGGHDVAR